MMKALVEAVHAHATAVGNLADAVRCLAEAMRNETQSQAAMSREREEANKQTMNLFREQLEPMMRAIVPRLYPNAPGKVVPLREVKSDSPAGDEESFDEFLKGGHWQPVDQEADLDADDAAVPPDDQES